MTDRRKFRNFWENCHRCETIFSIKGPLSLLGMAWKSDTVQFVRTWLCPCVKIKLILFRRYSRKLTSRPKKLISTYILQNADSSKIRLQPAFQKNLHYRDLCNQRVYFESHWKIKVRHGYNYEHSYDIAITQRCRPSLFNISTFRQYTNLAGRSFILVLK